MGGHGFYEQTGILLDSKGNLEHILTWAPIHIKFPTWPDPTRPVAFSARPNTTFLKRPITRFQSCQLSATVTQVKPESCWSVNPYYHVVWVIRENLVFSVSYKANAFSTDVSDHQHWPWIDVERFTTHYPRSTAACVILGGGEGLIIRAVVTRTLLRHWQGVLAPSTTSTH